MLLCSPAGGDLLFEESLTEQGRNFANKIWNAFRLVKNWEVNDTIEQPQHSKMAINWFNNKLNQTIQKLDTQFEQFRLSEALMTVYRLFWDEFSSWYLEIIKPAYQQPIDKVTLNETLNIFDKLLHILHPFMPFITEEIWHYIDERKDGESIMIDNMPVATIFNEQDIILFEQVKEIVSGIRTIRKDKNIPQKNALELIIDKGDDQWPTQFESVIVKLASLSELSFDSADIDNAISFMVKTHKLHVPVGDLLDKDAELDKLQKELVYTKGFLNTVMKKLSNKRFVDNAPKNVVESERKKQSDAELKIKSIEQQIKSLL